MPTRLNRKPWVRELLLIATACLCVALLVLLVRGSWIENNLRSPARISGAVDAAFLQKTKEAISTGHNKLIVTSTGGDPSYGIKIAKLLLEHEITVVVRGVCLSACASYIFLPASHRVIEPRSIVGFHHDSYSFSEHLLENERPLNPQLASDREETLWLHAQRDELMWRELSMAALNKLKPIKIQEARCESIDGSDSTKVGPCFSIRAIYQIWIPTTQDYKRFNISVDFRAPVASQEFAASRILCGEGLATTPMLFGSQLFFGSERCE